MSPARVALALLPLFLSAGCTSNCQELADRICGCLFEGSSLDNCKAQVKSKLEHDPKPTSADQAFCAGKLATCPSPGKDPGMCDRLNTCQGKVDCGLAHEPPGGCAAAAPPEPTPAGQALQALLDGL